MDLAGASDPASPASPGPASGPEPDPAGPWPFAARAALVLLAVALHRAALPPFGLAPLALVATAPFLLALRGLTPRQGLRVGFVFGLLSAAACAHWFLNVFHPAFAAVLWLLLALFPGAYGAGHAFARRRGELALGLVAPSLWIALEWFRCEGWHLKFAWFTLGHLLAGDELLRQSADLAGVYGLSFFGFLVSFLLARAIEARRSGTRLVLGLIALSLVATVYARGNRVLGFAPSLAVERATPGVKVLAVQDEWINRIEPKRSLTIAAVASGDSPDVILWPEDAFMAASIEATHRPALLEIARLARAAFVFGSARRAPGPPVNGVEPEWNAAIVLDPGGKQTGEYHKTVPVQFVESCVPGEGSPVFDLAGTRVGIAICYDGTYAFVLRHLVQNGARVLLLPTWDVSTWGPTQHAHHALFYPLRACELRRPIVRAASSGVTLAVDAYGRELGRIPHERPGTLSVTVVPGDRETPYVRGGWMFPHVAIAWAVLSLACCALRRVTGA